MGGRGVEAAKATGALARDHASEQGGCGHLLDVRQSVTSCHEASLVARHDAVEVEPPRRRRIAYYIAHAHGRRRQRADVQEVPVTQEGQHAVTACAHPQRVAAPQDIGREVGEAQGSSSSKRRRAMGASSSSRNSSAHHPPNSEESVIEEPATGTRVTTLTGR